MGYCDGCKHLQYEADVNACYCDLDLPEPEIIEDVDEQIQCYEYDDGQPDYEDDDPPDPLDEMIP